MFGKFTYLLLDLGSLLFPLLLSFDKKVAFYKNWKFLLPSIALTASLFVVWDIYFTKIGVWSFNPEYVCGIWIAGLPIEEWLFFICIPYSCVFVYECLKTYILQDYLEKYSIALTYIFMIVLLGVTFYFPDRIYTNFTFLGLGAALYIHIKLFKNKHLGWFILMWLIHLVPFFTINGILTSIPIVMYDNTKNMGIRIGTVPFEDAFYSMLMLILVISMMESLKAKFSNSKK